MLKTQRRALLVTLSIFVLYASASAQTESLPLKLLSPDRQLEITFMLDAKTSAPVYAVSYRGEPVITPSSLGLEFKQHGLLSENVRVTDVQRGTHDETYTLVAGKTHEARDHYNEMMVSLAEQREPKRQLKLIFALTMTARPFVTCCPNRTA